MSKLISIILASLIIFTSMAAPTYAGDWRHDRYERSHDWRQYQRARREHRRELRRERRAERREWQRHVRRTHRYRSYRDHSDSDAALAIGAFALGAIIGTAINNQRVRQEFPPAPRQPVQRTRVPSGCLC